MSEDAEAAGEAPKKKKGLLFGLIGALVLGGGAFFGVYSGLIPLGGEEPHAAGDPHDPHGGEAPVDYASLEPPSYVPIDELVISLGPDARSRHLRVVVELEVQGAAVDAVSAVKPRVIDVLNTFLRAVDEAHFEMPSEMARLRAQMLRRVRLVTPEGAVNDVLIQEFVLN